MGIQKGAGSGQEWYTGRSRCETLRQFGVHLDGWVGKGGRGQVDTKK